ncbi:hypothetical protein CSUI_006260 [Cystoisospora suis]|uniref:Uncharacterized protein n=1 Tax=Cystoisospora suis TaxID=483139 RepID=A0A2C6KUJ8_9APIC|nr:hypothetical protein CSUI_006260 [Cystoisospora suis]
MENPSASTSSGSGGAQTSSSPYHHQVSFTGVIDSSGLAGSPTSAAAMNSSSGSAGYPSSSSHLTYSSSSAPPPSGVAMTGLSQDSSMMYSSSSSSATSSSPPLPSGGHESLQSKEGIFKEGTPYVSTTTQQPADPTAVQLAAIGQQQALYGPMGLPYNIHMMMNASQRPTAPPPSIYGGAVLSSTSPGGPAAVVGGAEGSYAFGGGAGDQVEGIPICNSFYTGPPSAGLGGVMGPSHLAPTPLPGPCYYDPYGMINPAACITPLPLAPDDPKKIKLSAKTKGRGWCC